MAENLGQAQLELTVDLRAFEQGLEKAQKALRSLEAPELKAVATGVQVAAKELKNLTTAADKAEVKLRTLNQVIGDIPGAAYSKISAQIARLTSESRNLTTSGEQYLTVLQRIKELEFLRSARVGRQSANAGAAAFSESTLTTGYGANANLPQIPLTLEGERQNIRELQQRLANLNYESSAYAETLRVLERAQQRYSDLLNGISSGYRQLAQQEEAAIRRAEKLASIQSYYADQNPRAGGVRDASGAMLARGAGATADERAYQAALRPAKELLETDLKRAQALREISQRILQSADALKGGFGTASASNFGTTDPVQKSIRRNAEKQAASLERLASQREALESDLLEVQTRRLNAERKAAGLIERSLKDASFASNRSFAQPLTPGPLGKLRQSVAQNGSSAAGNALIGGAFPALFGQGLGASFGGGIGGGIGGLAGGNFGFGLSLIGTALGAQVDEAVRKLGLIGSALDDPIGKFQELADAGLISSKALEKNIAALIANGQEAEASARIQLDIAKQFGDTKELQALSDASGQLQRSFASASVVLAKFIAGPLQDFISKLALSFSLIAQRGVVSERVSQLGLSDQQRTSIVAEARNNVGGDPRRLYEEVNRLLDERYGKTKQVLDAERLITEAQTRQSKLLSNSYRQIDADAFGNKRLKIEKEIEAIELKRKQSLSVQGIAEEQAAKINKDAALQTYKLKQDAAKLDRDTWAQNIAAANQLLSIRDQIFIQGQRQNLTSTGLGALTSVAEFRNAVRSEQNAQAALRANPGDSSLRNAAAQSAEETKLAAAKTKQDLLSAYTAAADSVKQISRSIEDAKTAFNAMRGSAEGVNKYINPEKAQERQLDANKNLFNAADKLASKLGVVATFSGSLTERNSQLVDFISSARAELRSPQDLSQLQTDLLKSNNDLSVVNEALKQSSIDISESLPKVIDALSVLSGKDWNVYVSVPGGSASGDVVREGVYQ